MKGFYMSIDIALAASLTMVVLLLVLVAFLNTTKTDMAGVTAQKMAESTLYTLKNTGILDQAVTKLESSNQAQAKVIILQELNDYGIPLSYDLNMRTYDANLTLRASIEIHKGAMKEMARTSSIATTVNGTQNKYTIVTMEVGK